MSLLRPSIAGRLLRAGVPTARKALPGSVRYDTTTALGTKITTLDAPGAPAGDSLAKSGEDKAVNVRHNQPDYGAEVDQASS